MIGERGGGTFWAHGFDAWIAGLALSSRRSVAWHQYRSTWVSVGFESLGCVPMWAGLRSWECNGWLVVGCLVKLFYPSTSLLILFLASASSSSCSLPNSYQDVKMEKASAVHYTTIFLKDGTLQYTTTNQV